MSPPIRFAVFGNPIAHSKSPIIHQLFAAQCGINLEYTREWAALDGFAAALMRFRDDGGSGCNVTVPFKEEAARLATRPSARVRLARAANTLWFTADAIHADNTDGVGLVRDLSQHGVNLRSARVLLLGAGGAARGVIAPLLDVGVATLVVANRSVEKALSLLDAHREYQQQHAPNASLSFRPLADSGFEYDVVINATSAGLADSTLPLDRRIFRPGIAAYDMVYGRETPFMTAAKAAGATVFDGLGMLVEQAAEAFFLWHGVRPQTPSVAAALARSQGT